LGADATTAVIAAFEADPGNESIFLLLVAFTAPATTPKSGERAAHMLRPTAILSKMLR